MTEICREPIETTDENGDKVVSFDANHTWGDIVRWIMRDMSDAEEVRNMLNDALENGTR